MTRFAVERKGVATPQQLAERVLERSSADHCLVIAEESSRTHLRWANNALTGNGDTRVSMLTVIAVADGLAGRVAGIVSQSGATEGSVETLTSAAEAAARNGPPAEDAAPLVAGSGPAHDWSDPAAETSIHVFDSFVPTLAEAFDSACRERRTLYGYAEHRLRTTFLASSAGLRVRYDHPCGYVQMSARSASGQETAWAGAGTPDFSDVSAAALYGGLRRRLAWGRGRRATLPAGRYETLLSPSAVGDLMVCMYAAAGARDAYDGRSAFALPRNRTRVGQRLSQAGITLRSDPAATDLECSPFFVAALSDSTSSVFDNGLTLRPTSWIADDTLSALVQTRHSAGLTGLPATPRIDNLIMEGPAGGPTLDEMIRSTARGLLVTCLWYIREVHPPTLQLTGLTRDGVFLIEDGEVVGAVNNFRFNESPVELLARVTEVGRTERALAREYGGHFPLTAMPWLRVEHFNFSGVSEAS